MKRLVFLTAAMSVAAAVPALAQQPAAEAASVTGAAPGQAAAANVVRITASVEGVDAANRTVTLKGPRARVVTLPVGPEVSNFDQIKPGDIVVVRYIEALSLDLKKAGTDLRERTETETSGTAKSGARPAAGELRQVTVTADVIGVDPKRQIVTLRAPKRTVDLKVRDPSQLRLIKVGDQVEASYTEAAVISVEPVTRAAPATKPAG
jgi:Cu/Ag efflux protein CusF